MKKTNVRPLHLNTTSIIREVEEGETYVLKNNGMTVAELKPMRAVEALHCFQS